MKNYKRPMIQVITLGDPLMADGNINIPVASQPYDGSAGGKLPMSAKDSETPVVGFSVDSKDVWSDTDKATDN